MARRWLSSSATQCRTLGGTERSLGPLAVTVCGATSGAKTIKLFVAVCDIDSVASYGTVNVWTGYSCCCGCWLLKPAAQSPFAATWQWVGTTAYMGNVDMHIVLHWDH